MKSTFAALLLLFAVKSYALDGTHFTINRVSAPYFIIDGNAPATVNNAYVAFEIINNANSNSTYSGLRFTISSIGTSVSGQNYQVISPSSAVINVGTLAPGESKVCYFYVKYPAHVTAQATFNTLLNDNTAGTKTQSFIIRNRSSISANAGGTATHSITNQDLIGGIISDEVTYTVGNVKSGDESDFQVAVSPQFDPTKITLLSTAVVASSVPGINSGTTDSLYFITGNGSNGSTVTVRWTFRITSYNFTTFLLPCAGATSGGSNYKYALNTTLGSGTPLSISASANPLTISKTADHPVYGPNSTSIFTVTISNPGMYGITIDRITDQLPAGFTFQSIDPTSQVKANNSTEVPTAGATGTIQFEGGVQSSGNTSYYIAPGSNYILRYRVTTAGVPSSNLLTEASSFVGTTLIGTAQNTVAVSTTLPLTLISFQAQKTDQYVQLKWITSNETNSNWFIIERSIDGNNFQSIGKLEANGQPGTASTYGFTDSIPAPGVNLYRLKMIDHLQQHKFSAVQSVNMGEKDQFEIIGLYPNPVIHSGKVVINSSIQQVVTVNVFDMQGKKLSNYTIHCQKEENQSALNLDHLQPGTYILRVEGKTGIRQQKFMKL